MLVPVLSVLKLRLEGLSVNLGGAGGVQLHGTLTIFAGPLKAKVALAEQVVSGTEMVTFAV